MRVPFRCASWLSVKTFSRNLSRMDLVDVGVVISTPLQRSAFSIMLMYRRSALAAREHCSVQTRFLTTVTKLDRMMLRAASRSGSGRRMIGSCLPSASTRQSNGVMMAVLP